MYNNKLVGEIKWNHKKYSKEGGKRKTKETRTNRTHRKELKLDFKNGQI